MHRVHGMLYTHKTQHLRDRSALDGLREVVCPGGYDARSGTAPTLSGCFGKSPFFVVYLG